MIDQISSQRPLDLRSTNTSGKRIRQHLNSNTALITSRIMSVETSLQAAMLQSAKHIAAKELHCRKQCKTMDWKEWKVGSLVKVCANKSINHPPLSAGSHLGQR